MIKVKQLIDLKDFVVQLWYKGFELKQKLFQNDIVTWWMQMKYAIIIDNCEGQNISEIQLQVAFCNSASLAKRPGPLSVRTWPLRQRGRVGLYNKFTSAHNTNSNALHWMQRAYECTNGQCPLHMCAYTRTLHSRGGSSKANCEGRAVRGSVLAVHVTV